MTRKDFLKQASITCGFSLLGLDSLKGIAQAATSSSFPVRHRAEYWQAVDDTTLQCRLCPRQCLISEKQRGFCRVRENQEGTLYTLVYGQAAAAHIDPMEKKPLFHFLPGTTAFSIATAGCNLRCKFCQNWEISQATPEEVQPISLGPGEITQQAKSAGSQTVAYTYTEPVIFYEYMLDAAKTAKAAGLRNIMHSAGMIQEGPLRNLCKHLDAANIDLKAFTQSYYNDICFGNLEDILKTLKIIKEEKVHLEITNLVLPGLNDSSEEIEKMCLWIKENLGVDTPLHFSRFWPQYKLTNLAPTPVSALENAQGIAKGAGLNYAYIGNIPGHQGETTFCPVCKKAVIVRKGYTVTENNLIEGRCKFCQAEIKGVWS